MRNELIRRYAKTFGCENPGAEVCWCKVCAGIDSLISDVKAEVIKEIKKI